MNGSVTNSTRNPAHAGKNLLGCFFAFGWLVGFGRGFLGFLGFLGTVRDRFWRSLGGNERLERRSRRSGSGNRGRLVGLGHVGNEAIHEAENFLFSASGVHLAKDKWFLRLGLPQLNPALDADIASSAGHVGMHDGAGLFCASFGMQIDVEGACVVAEIKQALELPLATTDRREREDVAKEVFGNRYKSKRGQLHRILYQTQHSEGGVNQNLRQDKGSGMNLAQVDRSKKLVLDRINKMGKINQQVSIRARFGQILLILSKTSSVDGNDAFAVGVFFF